MVLVVYSSVILLFLLYFCTTNHPLHLFEILFVWFMIIFLHENFLALFSLNLKWIEPSDEPQMITSIVISRIFFTPAIIIWSIGCFYRIRVKSVKGGFLLLILGLLVGLDYAGDYYGLYTFKGMKVWVVIVEWSTLLLLAFIIQVGYRKLIGKGGHFNA
ncbi:hypothetical protein [Bacillus sp. Marseille-Q3570]|uniref:hypothetical protein n=1 Tax=Bacillus sp. Marseille-Q3570 TaxID=2963522 RepID=UPI0021B7FF02|nr:hypothetical protein [Bacillus sp. Marseille-Q3570]